MQRRSLRTSLCLFVILALLPLGALAANIKNITAPEAVFLGFGDIIDRELVNVRSSYFRKPNLYVLVLSLEELRDTGEFFFLGEQAISVAALNVIAEDGGDGRAVVEVAWITDPIAAGSLITACATVVKQARKGDVVVSEECRTLTPILPL